MEAANKNQRVNPSASRGKKVEHVRSMLFEDIFNGQLQPGQRLTAETLAARYHVTRTPVREALMQMTRENIVESIPNAGFRLREFSSQEKVELYELREHLEGMAANKLARLGVNADLLKRLHESAHLACNGASFNQRRNADLAFHQHIIVGCGSKMLAQLADNCLILSNCFVAALDHPQVKKDGDTVYHEHLAIIQALQDGDGDDAAKLLRRHIRKALREMTKRRRGSAARSVTTAVGSAVGDDTAQTAPPLPKSRGRRPKPTPE